MATRLGSAAVVGLAASLALAALSGCSNDKTVAETTGGDVQSALTVPVVAGLTPQRAIEKLCAAGFSVGSVKVVKRTPQVDAARASAAVKVVGTIPDGGRVVNSATAPTGSGTTVPAKPATVPVVLRLSEPRNVAMSVRTSC